MKKILSLLLCLGLVGLLAACGSSGEPSPEAVPAPEIVDSATIQADPFAAYFDLSGLSQETLDGAIQDVNLGDNNVQIIQTLNDELSYYVAFDVNWPEGTDPASETAEASLSFLDHSYYGEVYGSISDNTGSYIATFTNCFIPEGGEVSFTVTLLGQEHTYSWTVENASRVLIANLEDSEGTVVGVANLTPFSLRFTIDDPYISGIADGDTIQLLDDTGAPLPETWATSGDPSAAFLEFYIPMELGTVKTLQVGPYTAHF